MKGHELNPGDYVLATKYGDGDPGDHFVVGFFRGKRWHDRYDVVDGDGRLMRGNGFRRAEKITKEEGTWILDNLESIELSGVSLWSHLNQIREPTSSDPNRSDAPKCPRCGLGGTRYIVMWDYHKCPNGHEWDGPLNGGPPLSNEQKNG